jgi:hypothetical protein
MSPRFGLQEAHPAPETGACDDGAAGDTTGAVARTAVSAESAPTSTHGRSSIRIGAHETRSSIQAGSSSHELWANLGDDGLRGAAYRGG